MVEGLARHLRKPFPRASTCAVAGRLKNARGGASLYRLQLCHRKEACWRSDERSAAWISEKDKNCSEIPMAVVGNKAKRCSGYPLYRHAAQPSRNAVIEECAKGR